MQRTVKKKPHYMGLKCGQSKCEIKFFEDRDDFEMVLDWLQEATAYVRAVRDGIWCKCQSCKTEWHPPEFECPECGCETKVTIKQRLEE